MNPSTRRSTNRSIHQSTNRLIDQSNDRSSIHRLVGRLVDWSAGWLVASRIHRLGLGLGLGLVISHSSGLVEFGRILKVAGAAVWCIAGTDNEQEVVPTPSKDLGGGVHLVFRVCARGHCSAAVARWCGRVRVRVSVRVRVQSIASCMWDGRGSHTCGYALDKTNFSVCCSVWWWALAAALG